MRLYLKCVILVGIKIISMGAGGSVGGPGAVTDSNPPSSTFDVGPIGSGRPRYV